MAAHLSIALRNLNFNDTDEFTETTRAWDLDFRQTEPGAFRADLQQLGTDRVQFGHARFLRSLSQEGTPPTGYHTIVVPAADATDFYWRGHVITRRNIAIFPFGGELEAGSRPGFHIYTVSITPEFLEELAEAMDLPLLGRIMQETEVMTPEPNRLAQLRGELELYSGLATSQVPEKALVDSLEFDLTRLALWALSGTGTRTGVRNPRLGEKAFRRIRDLLKEFPDEAWTVRQLCKVAGVSERTLQYVFLERFGVTPSQYLKAFRLTLARRSLKSADPDLTTVTEVAHAWGFWHLGQFSADYRRFFGELPSQTLKGTG